MKTKEDILRQISDEDVEFIRLQFTDPWGYLKNAAVTPGELEKVLEHGYVFDGREVFRAEEELYLKPDLDTLTILPWRPQSDKVARLICDVCTEDGEEFARSPRTILKRTLKEAGDAGYSFYIDPEFEFFLFHTDENGEPTTVTHEHAGYMDVGPVDLGENARRDMVLMLEQMGFNIRTSYHESAPAQHEIDFEEGMPLSIADDIMTFKSAVRAIATRFGLHATFMPQPIKGIPGSGMHLNLSVYHGDYNILKSPASGDMESEGGCFIGGIMEHVPAIYAVTNPLVNSYKRTFEKRIRVRTRRGEDVKVELCFPDPTANPYLALAVIIQAGIKGVEKKQVPAKDLLLQDLPEDLKEAVRNLQSDEVIRQAMGTDFASLYAEVKLDEWREYLAEISRWELQKYLYRV